MPMNSKWDVPRLGQVALVERSAVKPENIISGTTYIGMEHIDNDGEFKKTPSVESGELASNKFSFDERHVLYGKLRPYLKKIARPSFHGICSTDILPILPKDSLNKDYLYYFLRQPHMIEFAVSRCSGANLPRLSPKELTEFPIPLPPLEEQKRIAAILDKADAIRKKRKQAIELTEQFLRSAFLDMFGDPITNPKGWTTYKMGDVIEFKGGSQPPKSSFSTEDKTGYVRLIQIRDFKSDKYPTYIPKKKATRPFAKDDVMIARYGPPVFQILRGLEGTYNVALMKASPRGEGITKDFIFHLLQTPKIHDYVVANSERTAGQSGVNLDLLNHYLLPLPPLEIQETIIQTIKIAEQKKSKQVLFHTVAIDLCAALAAKAFRGEL